MTNTNPDMHISKSPDARVVQLEPGYWHLEIPANLKRGYRLAQLDDHGGVRRRDFRWKPPLTLTLQARVSAQDLPGTWGFGFWNDPFSFLLGSEGFVQRLPALPDAAWFFHASSESYLSFRDDLPASGYLGATFRSTQFSPLWLALASPILALTLIPGAAQLVRKLLRHVIEQDASQIETDVTAWHTYGLDWDTGQVRYWIDGNKIAQTDVAPPGPLSLVLWIDNQYAALSPKSGIRYGTLPNKEPAWLEIRNFVLQINP